MQNITVIIPSYNPDVKLTMFVDELIMSGFSDIVVIDDGSDFSDRKVITAFEYVEGKNECTLLHHDKNMGKGIALKTGFKYCMAERHKDTLVVTADDDGQYTGEQIVECLEYYGGYNQESNTFLDSLEDETKDSSDHRAEGCIEKLRPVLLAPRDFRDTNYAARKRLLNHVAGFVMKYLCAVKVKDVQTGLRFIPYEYLAKFIEVEGNGFDYEINMLVELKYKKIPYIERQILIEPIAKQYADYNPLRDIVKFFGVMIKYAVSSLSATVIDLIAFYLLMLLCGSESIGMNESVSLLVATIVSRIISATFSCVVNKRTVFKSDMPLKGVIVKFYIFTMFRAVLSYGAVYGLAYLLGSYGANLTVVIKLVVDLILFFVGYDIQKKWIF